MKETNPEAPMTKLLPDGTYVELKAGCDEVYTLAPAGSRGTIRFAETDEYGFDKVYIEWDQEHWRFNGEPDGWTYASHFKPVSPVEPVEDAKEAPDGPDLMFSSDAEVSAENYTREHIWDEEHMEDYIDSMMHSFDQAAESDGFVLITMRRVEDSDQGPMIVYEISRGSALPDLFDIPPSMILSFIGEQMRHRGQ